MPETWYVYKGNRIETLEDAYYLLCDEWAYAPVKIVYFNNSIICWPKDRTTGFRKTVYTDVIEVIDALNNINWEKGDTL